MSRQTLKQEVGERILELPGVELKPSRFGSGKNEAFTIGRREFAHFHKGNEIDVRVTRAVIRTQREELKEDARATISGGGDWVEYRFPRRGDLERVMELVDLAVAANS